MIFRPSKMIFQYLFCYLSLFYTQIIALRFKHGIPAINIDFPCIGICNVTEKLGEGGFSDVYKIQCQNSKFKHILLCFVLIFQNY